MRIADGTRNTFEMPCDSISSVLCPRKNKNGVELRIGQDIFDLHGGATIILDPTGAVRYVIRKSVVSSERLQGQCAYAASDSGFWGDGPLGKRYPEARLLRMLHGVR
jgi:hypothetical protein